MSKIYIRDDTGEVYGQKRKEYIQGRLASRGINSEDWRGEAVPIVPEGFIVFAHSSNLSGDERVELETAANSGGIVVFYSAGVFPEKVVARGLGWRFELPWVVLQEVIERLPSSPTLSDFRMALEAVSKRGILVALATLCLCATSTAEDAQVEKLQNQWKLEPQKWRRLFYGVNASDAKMACGIDDGGVWPIILNEVGRLVSWIWDPSKDESEGQKQTPPDFERALNQIREFFTWMV